MSLPILIDPVSARAIAANEARITDQATTLIAQGECDDDFTAELRDHLAAVQLANELAYAHESQSPADADLYQAAVQLRLWHLHQLDSLTTCPEL